MGANNTSLIIGGFPILPARDSPALQYTYLAVAQSATAFHIVLSILM